MPDIEKHERFRGRFNNWRRNADKKTLQNEQLFLDIALIVNDYVDDHDFKAIQSELLNENSDVFISFKPVNQPWSRSLGTVLYGKLAIEEYIHHLESAGQFPLSLQEKHCLEELNHCFSHFYLTPRNNPQQQSAAFFKQMDQWVENFSEKSPNIAKSKELCLAFYTILKIGEISLERSNKMVGQLVNWFTREDLVDQAKANVHQLLEKIAVKIAILQKMQTSKRIENTAQEFEYTSLENYYDCRCLEIFANQQFSMEEKIAQIKAFILNANQKIAEIIEFKKSEKTTYDQMTAAEVVNEAIVTNQNVIFRRKYARSLLDSIEPQVEMLINGCSEEEKAAWKERIQEIKRPSLVQQTVDTTLLVGSIVSYLPTVITRTLLPTGIQEGLINYPLPTRDSDFKWSLKELALQRYKETKDCVDKVETTIKQLARRNRSVVEQMQKCTTEDLELLIKQNRSRLTLYNQFERLLVLRSNIQKLSTAEAALTLYLHTYCNFFTYICIWIFRTFAINLSNKAVCAAQIQSWQQGLRTSIQDIEKERERDIQSINSTNDLLPLKEPMFDQLRIITIQEPQPIPHNNYITAYRHVETLFNKATAVPLPPANAPNMEEPLPRPVV